VETAAEGNNRGGFKLLYVRFPTSPWSLFGIEQSFVPTLEGGLFTAQ